MPFLPKTHISLPPLLPLSSLLIHLFPLIISSPCSSPSSLFYIPASLPSPSVLSCRPARSQSGEHFKCVWSSWLITAFEPRFVNTEQLIVVWMSCVAGGPSALLFVYVRAQAHVCLYVSCPTVLNTARMGINTPSLSSACVQTWVTSSENKTYILPSLCCQWGAFRPRLQSSVTDYRPDMQRSSFPWRLRTHTHTQVIVCSWWAVMLISYLGF